MSVEKFNPLFENEIIPYTQICTKVIQEIDNPVAGWIWVYLLSKPATWKVVKEHVKNKFGFGDAKVKQIFAYLKKHNLIEYLQETTKEGKFGQLTIKVLNGSKFKSYPQNDDKTAGSISVRAENRTNGSGALVIKEKEVIKEKKEKALVIKENLKEPVMRGRARPNNPLPDRKHMEYCAERRLEVNEEMAKFQNWCDRNGIAPRRRGALFMKFLKQSADFKE